VFSHSPILCSSSFLFRHTACFWHAPDGATHPQPFTAISSQDVIDKKWVPRSDLDIHPGTLHEDTFGPLDDFLKDDGSGEIDLYKYAVEYTKRLEERGRFQLVIWPEHCLIGSLGHCVVKEVHDALENWSKTTGGSVEWVLKGQNLLTESYSAIEADVPVNRDTSFATDLHASLLKSDSLLVTGQASSHCVNYTTESIVDRWPKEDLSQITVLTDCMSAVPGFETAAQEFHDRMAKIGVKLQKSTEIFQDP
jgi:nicotinamidase-related amidase